MKQTEDNESKPIIEKQKSPQKSNFSPQPKYIIAHQSHGGEIYNVDITLQRPLIDYSTNINPYVEKEKIRDNLVETVNQLENYPDSYSQKVTHALQAKLGSISEANIIIGAGAMDLICLFCDCFISPYDQVLILQPTFSEYEWAVKKNGGIIVNQFRDPTKDFKLDTASIINSLTPAIKAIFICNPNNPNGLLDDASEIESIIKSALERNIYVLLDEAFIEFTDNGDKINYSLEQYPNLFICRSFTKFYSIPGLRIGYGLGAKMMIQAISSFHPLWTVNIFAQETILPLIQDIVFQIQSRDLLKEQREFMQKTLAIIPGLKIFPSNVNYLLLNSREIGLTAEEIQKALLKQNILIRNCQNYVGLDEYYFRICIKDQPQNELFISKFLPILKIISLVNPALKNQRLNGPDKSCKYYPCHSQVEDCTFCYCPFYPCKNPQHGGRMIQSKKTGESIWDCSLCTFSHKKVNAEKILKALIEEKKPFELISSDRLRAIHKKLFEESK